MESRTPIHRTYSDDIFNQLLDGVGKKLNLGCGNDYLKGWTNLDRDPSVKPDVIADLENDLPFDNDSFNHVLASHIFEHVKDLVHLKAEIWRILKPKGTLAFIVPHYLSPDAWGSDDHVRAFSEHMFIEENWQGWRYLMRKTMQVPYHDNDERLAWLYGKYEKVKL